MYNAKGEIMLKIGRKIISLVTAVAVAVTGLSFVNAPSFYITAGATYMYEDEAKPVRIGEVVTGKLDDKDVGWSLNADTAYYKVEISRQGTVSVTRGGKAGAYSSGQVTAKVFDSAGKAVALTANKITTDYIAGQTFNAERAGTYYIEISGRNTDYAFIVNDGSVGRFLLADTAKPLAIGDMAEGHLSGNPLFAWSGKGGPAAETHYYKVQLNHSGNLIITSGGKGYKIAVYDVLNNAVSDLENKTDGGLNTTSKQLPAGTYYIEVGGSDADYFVTTRLEYDGIIIGKYIFAKDAKPLAFAKPTNGEIPDNGLIDGYIIAAWFTIGLDMASGGGAAPGTEQFRLDVPRAGKIDISVGGGLANISSSLVCFNEYGVIVGKSSSKTLTVTTNNAATLYVALTGSGGANYKILADFTATSGAGAVAGSGTFAPSATTPSTATQPFKSGVVAQGVTAANGTNAITIKWGEVAAARYAVYYIPRNNATGAFGNWNTVAADTNSYTIQSPAKGVTYYVTILPFTDTPSRQYGGFSAYTTVKT